MLRIVTFRIVFLVIVSNVLVSSWSSAQSHKIAVLPFLNKSGFEHDHWDITRGIVEALSDSLSYLEGIAIATPENIEKARAKLGESRTLLKNLVYLRKLARELHCRALIFGDITEFTITRFGAGNPILAGYESYEAAIGIQYFFYDDAEGALSEGLPCHAAIKDRYLGVTLLGKPSERSISYDELDRMPFGSREFYRTIIGRALTSLKASFYARVSGALGLHENDELEEYVEAKVLLVQGNDVYLNAGSDDNVSVGDVLSVYTKGEALRDPESGEIIGYADKQVAKIKILQIRDAHLSLAKLVESEGTIHAKDSVRIRKR